MTAPETLEPCLRCGGQIVITMHKEPRIGVHIPPTLYSWCCTRESCRIRSNEFTARDAAVEHANRRTPTPSPTGAPEGEYDKAVAALAPYLPDGWIAQDRIGRVDLYHEPPIIRSKDHTFWAPKVGRKIETLGLRVPPCPDWRSSLRRIEKGRVVG